MKKNQGQIGEKFLVILFKMINLINQTVINDHKRDNLGQPYTEVLCNIHYSGVEEQMLALC